MSQLSSVPNQTPSRPFADVLAEMGKENVSYKDLLATNEWRVFRKTIIERDDYYCSKCGQSDTCWYNGTLLRFAKFYHDGKQEFPFELCRMVDKRYYLHAHHKHYILGRLPWEYSTDELTTLCNECHVQIHLDQVIQVYKQIGEVLQPLSAKGLVNFQSMLI